MFHRPAILLALIACCCSASIAQTTPPTAEDNALPMITIEGDKFVADGKEFKIWGFNQGRGLHLSDAQLKKTVDQLAFLGCNMLRLHTIDWTEWGDAPGPEGETMASGLLPVGPDRPDTQTLINVEEFYRLLDALREKGIYVAITLAVCKTYVPADVDILETTPEDAEAWQIAVKDLNGNLQLFKMLPVFDERALELRKKWASNLLNMKHPETGVRLAEDPQLALLNVVNECSMWSAFFRNNYTRNLPEYFKKKVREKWNAWLKAKYGNSDKLAAAWKEGGKKGLLPEESLNAGTVKLLPIDPVKLKPEEKKEMSASLFSKQRREDFVHFLYDMDAAHQRTMLKHFESLGWTRPAGYGDSVSIGPEVGQYWLQSDLLPYIEEHPYDDANVDLFGWGKIRVCTYAGSNFLPWGGQDRPMWASEIRNSNWGLGWTRIPFPLFVAVYHSLQGRDGCTWHVWAMGRNLLLQDEQNIADLSRFHCNWDIPWLFAYRAAGRLFKSGEIDELPKDDPARKRFSQWEANFKNDQVFRVNGPNAQLTVNTEHFRALATPVPQTVTLGDVTIDCTSETKNLVIVEKLSDDEIEITAVGKSGDFEKGKVNHFEPLEWVTGSVRVAGKTVTSIQHIDHFGNVIETVRGDRSDVPLIRGVRLYRAKLK